MKAPRIFHLSRTRRFSFARALVSATFLLAPAALCAQDAIPAGTVLPVRLNDSLSSQKSKPGQIITARVMQDVPLDQGKKVSAGSKVVGHVVEIIPASDSARARISLKFDTVVSSGHSIPIVTSLRALASLGEIDEAQIPLYGGDRGTPSSAYQNTQIGGEIVYRGGGHVMAGGHVVGEPAPNGVLSRLRPNPEGSCRGAMDENNQLQALWLFSSDACGVYGYPHLKIVKAGRRNPAGEIELAADSGDVKIRSGSGLLLRVVGSDSSNQDAS